MHFYFHSIVQVFFLVVDCLNFVVPCAQWDCENHKEQLAQKKASKELRGEVLEQLKAGQDANDTDGGERDRTKARNT